MAGENPQELVGEVVVLDCLTQDLFEGCIGMQLVLEAAPEHGAEIPHSVSGFVYINNDVIWIVQTC